MDRVRDEDWDVLIEDAIRKETLLPVPIDFTTSVMKNIKLDSRPKFQFFSWVELVLSATIAVCIGLAFLVPLLLPAQLNPWLHWLLQWVVYLFEKSTVSISTTGFTWVIILLVGVVLVLTGWKFLPFRHFSKKKDKIWST